MQEELHKFRSGPIALAEALHGITPEQAGHVPEPGKWNINQIVRHVADTEIVVGMRLRQIIAEDKPTLAAFDQDLWAAHLGYENANALGAKAVFDALRFDTTALLESLPAEAFDRTSVHPERGEKTLREWVGLFGNHVYSNAAQIKKIRGSM